MGVKIELNSGTTLTFNDNELDHVLDELKKDKPFFSYEAGGKKYVILTKNISAVYEI